MPVDIAQALELRTKNKLSYRQIAKLQDVSKDTIFNIIKPLLPDESTKIFKENRADILAHLQLRALSSINDEKIKKAAFRDIMVGAGILYDKERLERGLSTENVSYHGLMAEAGGLDEQLHKLERELARLDAQDGITKLSTGLSTGLSTDLDELSTGS